MADTKILIADDDDSIRFVLQKFLERADFTVDVAKNGRETLELFQPQTYAVVFLDIVMPDANGLDLLNDLKVTDETTSVVIITAHGDTQTAIEAAKRSAYDYITKPFDREALIEITTKTANASEHARSALLQRENNNSKDLASTSQTKGQIVGESAAMRQVYQTIGRAAVSHETVLIIGESGAGKELVAKAIHENSSRANEEFVVVDCSAIPSALIESALFG
ncbi:MAG: response regulator, partial [Candidatus Poribacteria bacterium]|nr:response regulator [Candidatus Poribacteria bacterium]